MMAVMGPIDSEPWFGDLYGFGTMSWLKPKTVPWQLILVLLGIWTLLVVSGSVFALFSKRWTPALSGFNFFCFGAQYADEVNAFHQCTI